MKGPAAPPQQVGNLLVLRCQAVPAVNHEEQDIGFSNRRLRLARHFLDDASTRIRLEPAGIDNQERLAAQAAMTVMPVARQPGLIRHQRVTRPRQPVE